MLAPLSFLLQEDDNMTLTDWLLALMLAYMIAMDIISAFAKALPK